MNNRAASFDTVVLGAGPAGLAATRQLVRYSRSVLLVDTGRHYTKRYCPVDHGLACHGCAGICNVIAGFGGSMHYGDGVKISLFPSGRRLATLLGQEALTLQAEALELLFGRELPVFKDTLEVDGPFSLKRYPVAYLSSVQVGNLVKHLYSDLMEAAPVVLALQTEARALRPHLGGWEVELHSMSSSGGVHVVSAKSVIVATGRRGIQWWRSQVRDLGLSYTTPTPSVGVRFECPSELLATGATIHPDFKTTVVEDGVKIKTFCFCAGPGGGRVKFTDYGPYTLLDGHVIGEPGTSKVGNFALLAQLRAPDGAPRSFEWIEQELLDPYLRLRSDRSGKPLLQWYPDFRAGTLKCTDFAEFELLTGFTPSLRDYGFALISSLLPPEIHRAFCVVFERLMDFFLPEGFDSDRHGRQVGVIGLELEGLWDELDITPQMETSLPGLYACGDCTGLAQGILQAAISGLAAATDIVEKAKPSRPTPPRAKPDRLLAAAVELAREAFGDNLRLAFVGGSYATGTAGLRSDIDLFVVVHAPDRSAELSFARRLRELHAEGGLDFDHYGELFDTKTLDGLLDFTDLCVERFPEIQQSACYQADCLLSVFRKGDIVYKFFADAKLLPTGDLAWLQELEHRAAKYFARYPLPRIQHQKGRLEMPPESPQSALLGSLTRMGELDSPDTPVGIGLHRWFGSSLLPRQCALEATRPTSAGLTSPCICPLSLPTANMEAVRLASLQCLGFNLLEGESS